MNVTKRILVTVVVGFLNAPESRAQTPVPQFEVASVKRNTACGRKGDGPNPSPGRFEIECIPVKQLIQLAYFSLASGVGIKQGDIEISGGPGWVESEAYDIAARAENNARVELMGGPMLQALLEDRFKLKIHRETKERAVYVLTVGKNGPKLEQTKEGGCVAMDLNNLPPPPRPGQPRPNFCGSQSMTRKGPNLVITGHGMGMERLAGQLIPRFAGRPVIDSTGLTGSYDFQLEFAPDNTMGESARRPEGAAPTMDVAGPTIFEALQKLGLKLESGKGRVEVLVIDHVERPSEN